MADKKILKMWKSYEKVLCEGEELIGDTQIEETRKAFYGGAAGMFQSFMDSVGSDTDEPTEGELGAVDALAEELREFVSSLKAAALDAKLANRSIEELRDTFRACQQNYTKCKCVPLKGHDAPECYHLELLMFAEQEMVTAQKKVEAPDIFAKQVSVGVRGDDERLVPMFEAHRAMLEQHFPRGQNDGQRNLQVNALIVTLAFMLAHGDDPNPAVGMQKAFQGHLEAFRAKRKAKFDGIKTSGSA